MLAPYALTANAFQGGGIDQYGQQSATTNFGLSCVGGGAKMVLDGLDYAAAMWNPEGDMGDMEMWELIEPFLYLGQRVKPNTAGRRAATAAAPATSACAWRGRRRFYEMQNIGNGRCFIQSGLWGGYPAAHRVPPQRAQHEPARAGRRAASPSRSASPIRRTRRSPARSRATTSSTSRRRRCPR